MATYLNKTLGTATNTKKFTIAVWCKRGDLSSNNYILAAGTNNNDYIDDLRILSNGQLVFDGYVNGATYRLKTEKQLRDAAQARFNQEEKALELRQLTFDLAQKELDAAEKLAKAQAANDATRLRIAQIGRQTGANANEAARGLNQGILENQLAILNEKSFKDQTAINAKKRELIELERQYANERFV